MPNPDTLPPDLSFEDAMERLEAILQVMEGDRLPLEQLLDRYETGVKLIAVCRERLEAARLRVEKVTLGNSEAPATGIASEPFAPSTESSEEKTPAPRHKRNSVSRPPVAEEGEDTLL